MAVPTTTAEAVAYGNEQFDAGCHVQPLDALSFVLAAATFLSCAAVAAP
jgi:hypothetical protein